VRTMKGSLSLFLTQERERGGVEESFIKDRNRNSDDVGKD